MIEINKDTKYRLSIRGSDFYFTSQDINELHDKLTTFINENFKELNPE